MPGAIGRGGITDVSSDARAQRRYETSIDRVGIALGAGSALGGLLIVALVVAGGQYAPLPLVLSRLFGSLLSAVAMTAVAGPFWLVLHIAGLRRGRHAALVAGLTALGLFTGAQTYGYSALRLPALDTGTTLLRWTSVLATSALVAAIAAGIGVLMWRIAYRRIG